jgi:hypothetical protein
MVSRDDRVNEFIVGENDIGITEVFEPPEELEPGVAFTKQPVVYNSGNVPAFVRVRIAFSDGAAEDILETFDYDLLNWEAHGGYYYYKHAVQPGASTTALFNEVRVATTRPSNGAALGGGDMLDFDILVYAESRRQPDPNETKAYPLHQEYKHIWDSGW